MFPTATTVENKNKYPPQRRQAGAAQAQAQLLAMRSQLMSPILISKLHFLMYTVDA